MFLLQIYYIVFYYTYITNITVTVIIIVVIKSKLRTIKRYMRIGKIIINKRHDLNAPLLR